MREETIGRFISRQKALASKFSFEYEPERKHMVILTKKQRKVFKRILRKE